jgi:hypothetical protein
VLHIASRLRIPRLTEQLAALLQQHMSPLTATALITPAAALGLSEVRAHAKLLAGAALALAPRTALNGLPLPSFEAVMLT